MPIAWRATLNRLACGAHRIPRKGRLVLVALAAAAPPATSQAQGPGAGQQEGQSQQEGQKEGETQEQTEEESRPPDPPMMTPARYDEDYSYLRDPKNRSGACWERFKFIPLDQVGQTYMTLGNETRLRYEQYWNNNFGSSPKRIDGYLRFRDLPYADLHLRSGFRIFGQLMAAYALRSSLTKNPDTDETGVEILQGFADGRLPLGSDDSLTVRVGRQIMKYGSGRFINEGPNVRLSFDGGRARWETGDWRVDGFYVRPVKHNFGSFNDHSDGARDVWSLYATRSLPQIGPGSGLDLYIIGYENKIAMFNQGTGHESRQTIGIRVFGSSGPWTWDNEVDFQVGNFAGGDIRAWGIGGDVQYTLAGLPLSPSLRLKVTALSGDRNPKDPSMQTFNAMFPQGGYFGESGVIGPANQVSLQPMFDLDLGSGWMLGGAAVFYWRQSLGDGIYGLGLNLIRPSDGSRARYIASQGDVTLTWQVNRNLSFQAAYSILVPGEFIEETGPPAETVHFVGAQVKFQF